MVTEVELTLTDGAMARASLEITIISVASVGSIRPIVITEAVLSSVTVTLPDVPVWTGVALSDTRTSRLLVPATNITFTLKTP
jgi:hypothetical protein